MGAREQSHSATAQDDATGTEKIAPVTPQREQKDAAAQGSLADPATDSGFDAGEPPVLTVSALVPMLGTVGAAVAAVSQAPPAYNAAVVAQLLEKHVRQLLVSESAGAQSGQPSVMLNLTDAVLPGTQITLTQTDDGWRLASQSTSMSSYRVVNELAPQLKARFAERGLGDLELEVSLGEAR